MDQEEMENIITSWLESRSKYSSKKVIPPLHKLSGGYLNYVFRACLESTSSSSSSSSSSSWSSLWSSVAPGDASSPSFHNSSMTTTPPTSTIILKLFPPFIAAKPDIPFDTDRGRLEGDILELLSTMSHLLPETGLVKAPRLFLRADNLALDSNKQNTSSTTSISSAFPVLVLEDCGDLPTLDAWLTSLSPVLPPLLSPGSNTTSFTSSSSSFGNTLDPSLPSYNNKSNSTHSLLLLLENRDQDDSQSPSLLGQVLGEAIAQLHVESFIATSGSSNSNSGGDSAPSGPLLPAWTATSLPRNNTSIDRSRFTNMPVQKLRRLVQYEGVKDTLLVKLPAEASAYTTFPERLGNAFLPLPSLEVREKAIQNCSEIGEAFATKPGFCLIHGDLWPRSILVNNVAKDSNDVGGDNNEENRPPPNTTLSPPPSLPPSSPHLFLIDWELGHWGNPAQDVGHLASHLYMLHELETTKIRLGFEQQKKSDAAAEICECCFVDGSSESSSSSSSSSPSSSSSSPLTELFQSLDANLFGTVIAMKPIETILHGNGNNKEDDDRNSSRRGPVVACTCPSSPFKTFWKHFLIGYRRKIDSYTPLNISSSTAAAAAAATSLFQAAWKEYEVERRACIHAGAEILARLGPFRTGGPFDKEENKIQTEEHYAALIARAVKTACRLCTS